MTATSGTSVAPAAASPWFQGTFAPVADECTDAALPVSGSLPAGRRGTSVRNGPNVKVPPVATDGSDVVVLDAGTLDEVARVHLLRRVPFGFHGSFFA